MSSGDPTSPGGPVDLRLPSASESADVPH